MLNGQNHRSVIAPYTSPASAPYIASSHTSRRPAARGRQPASKPIQPAASNTGSQDSGAVAAAQAEFDQLAGEIDNISSTTKFGQSNLLDGTFGANAAAESFSISGGSVTASTASFKLAGTFNGTALAATAVSVADGTYSTASSFQSAIQNGIDTTLTGNGIAAGAVTASVTDQGNGVWKVTLSSSAVGSGNTFATSASTGLTDGNSNTVKFDGTSAAQGAAGASFQIGADAGDTQAVNISKADSTTLGVAAGTDVSKSTTITAVQTAIKSVSTLRSKLGAYQNGFQHTINNLNVTVENLQSSNSAIQDTDMASEMVNFTKAQVLQQAGVSMLAQANSSSQAVLKLLG